MSDPVGRHREPAESSEAVRPRAGRRVVLLVAAGAAVALAAVLLVPRLTGADELARRPRRALGLAEERPGSTGQGGG
jgi:hypothetical protein